MQAEVAGFKLGANKQCLVNEVSALKRYINSNKG